MRLMRKLLLHICYSNSSILSLYMTLRATKVALISFVRRILILLSIRISDKTIQRCFAIFGEVWYADCLLFYLQQTEQSGVAVTLQNFIRKVLGSNLGRYIGSPVFSWILLLLLCKRRYSIRLSHDRFFRNYFHFVIYHSSYHATIYNLDTDSTGK